MNKNVEKYVNKKLMKMTNESSKFLKIKMIKL